VTPHRKILRHCAEPGIGQLRLFELSTSSFRPLGRTGIIVGGICVSLQFLKISQVAQSNRRQFMPVKTEHPDRFSALWGGSARRRSPKPDMGTRIVWTSRIEYQGLFIIQSVAQPPSAPRGIGKRKRIAL
jgi:hypothetical protein